MGTSHSGLVKVAGQTLALESSCPWDVVYPSVADRMIDPIELEGFKVLVGPSNFRRLCVIQVAGLLAIVAGLFVLRPWLASVGLLISLLPATVVCLRAWSVIRSGSALRAGFVRRRLKGLFIQAPKPSSISLPVSDSPSVSIIVPVYNQIAYTLRCLESLAHAQEPEGGIEVICADDRSTDETPHVLSSIEGLKVIRNDTNLGFLRSVNSAARQARGKYLLLLNNDTTVAPDFLRPMLETLRNDPTVGAVGSKLVFPNGRVQEFGCAVLPTGDTQFLEFEADSGREDLSGLREVDYCSAASLLIEKSLWDELGGFCEDFAPAYYEDVDLCMRIRAKGLKVVVDGRSVVEHWLRVSASGGQPATKNRKLFVQRWASVLQTERSH